MSLHRSFRVNAPQVVSELIDGEAVIMNLKSGNYYSSRQTCAAIWAGLEQGLTEDELLACLKNTYAGDPDSLARGLEAFLAQLLEQELIAVVETPAPPAPMPTPSAALLPFTPPVLEVFSDMRDLLLLDPIHDVTDAGWPTAKPTRPSDP